MKTLATLLFVLMLPFVSISQNGNIFAEVDGDHVTFWNTETWRNCAAQYQMFVDGDEFQITWLQYYNGPFANCMCYFDLSVTIGPLEPGSYNANVFDGYGMPVDSLFIGSTQFTIGERYRIDSLEIVDEYQSVCYDIDNISIVDTKNVSFNVFPNPASNAVVIKCFIDGEGELFVYNSLGQIIKQVTDLKPGENTFHLCFLENDPKIYPGLYTVILETESVTLNKKLIVF